MAAIPRAWRKTSKLIFVEKKNNKAFGEEKFTLAPN
jgi:hypothetical protein